MRTSPGQPFPPPPLRSAGTLNSILEVAELYQQQQRLGKGGAGEQGEPSTDVIKVRNDSGSARRLGEVLEVDDTSTLLTDLRPQHLWFKGVTPNANRAFGILRQITPSITIDKLQVSGVCKALVNFTHADHRAAYVQSGSYVLQSAFVGPAQIVHKAASGTGEKECAILLTPKSPLPAIVQVNDGAATAGDLLESNADGLHPARIRQFGGTTGGTVSTVQDAWLRLVDWFDTDGGTTIAEQGRYHGGIIMGVATSGGSTRPLVIAELGEVTYVAKGPSGGIAKGASGSCDLYNGDETDSGINKTAKALGFAIPSGTKWVTVQRMRGGSWYVGCWEA